MYASRTTQFIVGLFGILGIATLAILSLSLGKISIFSPPSYTLYANFDNVSGLKGGDAIQIAGVKVGKVLAINLAKDERARVVLQLWDGVQVDDEAIAAIKTSGLIGDKFVSIALGGGEKTLKNGDTVFQTQSSFSIEDVVGQLINSGGPSSEKGGGNSGGGNSGGGNQKGESNPISIAPANPAGSPKSAPSGSPEP